jgi:hypothetical protein
MATAKKHTVSQGECMSSLAFEHGFFWESLWSLPENAALKAFRDSPFVLKPGDVVHIPEPRQRQVSVATGARHVFRRKGVPAKLRLRLLALDEPLANLPYVLASGGRQITGTTDAQGIIEVYVPPNLPSATLRVGEGKDARVYRIAPRTLNPAREIDGIQARLANLGYYRGAIHGNLDAATVAAIKRFQRAQEIEVTGHADDATASALSDADSSAS